LITETQALYQKSHSFSDKTNNKLNRFNFYLEIFLTISVLLSSFLVISIEKDWWGGYEKEAPVSFKEWLANGKKFKK